MINFSFQISSFILQVNAYDNGEPRLSGSTHVEIALIDINDCHPIFTQVNYHFSLDEELEMNYTIESYVIGQVKATDCDIGLNAQLIYSLDTAIDYKMDHPFQVGKTYIIPFYFI